MNSDDTLEQPTQGDLNQILAAINSFKQDVNERLDTLENKVNERLDTLENKVNERLDTLENKVNDFQKESHIQFEAIRQGIVDNSARFDQLEAVALDAKSIALVARSQLTILTEELRHNRKVLA